MLIHDAPKSSLKIMILYNLKSDRNIKTHFMRRG